MSFGARIKECRQKSGMSRKARLFSAFTLAGAVILVMLVYSAVPKYPQPEYEVNSYAELVKTFSGDPQYLLPPEGLLPSKYGEYSVSLKSRFSHEKNGYGMSFEAQKGKYNIYTISCRLTDSTSDSELQIQTNSKYRGIALSITESHICFELDHCQYDIHFTEASKIFSEKALLIAQSIIDKSSMAK